MAQDDTQMAEKALTISESFWAAAGKKCSGSLVMCEARDGGAANELVDLEVQHITALEHCTFSGSRPEAF